MSHITRLTTNIKDVDLLEKTFQHLNFTYVTHGKEAFNIFVGKGLTINLIKNSANDDNFEFQYNTDLKKVESPLVNMAHFFSDGNGQSAIDKIINRIKQHYALEEFMKTAEEKGHTVTYEYNHDDQSYDVDVSMNAPEVAI